VCVHVKTVRGSLYGTRNNFHRRWPAVPNF
jgi:hypothetical protein